MKKEKEQLAAIIRDKDELLNRAKDLLRKAADNEKQLLRQVKIFFCETASRRFSQSSISFTLQIKMMRDYKLEKIKE